MGWREENAHCTGNFGSPQAETCHIKLHFGLPVDVLTVCSLSFLCLPVSEIFHTQSRSASWSSHFDYSYECVAKIIYVKVWLYFTPVWKISAFYFKDNYTSYIYTCSSSSLSHLWMYPSKLLFSKQLQHGLFFADWGRHSLPSLWMKSFS